MSQSCDLNIDIQVFAVHFCALASRLPMPDPQPEHTDSSRGRSCTKQRGLIGAGLPSCASGCPLMTESSIHTWWLSDRVGGTNVSKTTVLQPSIQNLLLGQISTHDLLG